jgi:hypothetical protein
VFEKAKAEKRASGKLSTPWGRGKRKNTSCLPDWLQNKQYSSTLPHIMVCKIAVQSSDTVGNLEMRSKGLIEYRKHDSLYISAFSMRLTCSSVIAIRV